MNKDLEKIKRSWEGSWKIFLEDEVFDLGPEVIQKEAAGSKGGCRESSWLETRLATRAAQIQLGRHPSSQLALGERVCGRFIVLEPAGHSGLAL